MNTEVLPVSVPTRQNNTENSDPSQCLQTRHIPLTTNQAKTLDPQNFALSVILLLFQTWIHNLLLLCPIILTLFESQVSCYRLCPQVHHCYQGFGYLQIKDFIIYLATKRSPIS